MYAVNIADMTKYRDRVLVMWLLRPLMVSEGQDWAGENATLCDCEPGRFDGSGALLHAPDERIAALVEWLREYGKFGKAALRIYYRKTDRSAWRRV